MENIWALILMILGTAIGICLGIILGERQRRNEVIKEMRDERDVLKETLRQISETHNMLVQTQKMQGEMMEDLTQKVTFMVQGIKGK